MVLKLTYRRLLMNLPLLGAALASPAMADPVSKTAPLVSEDIDDLAPVGINVGGFRLKPELEYNIFVDDNVYASMDNARSDAAVTIAGNLEAQRRMGDVRLGISTGAAIRRYNSLSSENSETGSARVNLNWQPRQTQRFNLLAGWERLVEDRGEPESQADILVGPRRSNLWEIQGRYAQESGQMTYSAEVGMRKFDFLGSRNDDRDFTVYNGTLTVGRAIGSRLYGTVTGFVTERDFRLPTGPLGIDQDQTTIGGRIGIATRERGLIEGRAQIGMFRLNSADPLRRDRNGLSADVSLTIRPQQRTAITINAFAGDVATFKLGADARTDKRLNVRVQQEIRHNLYASFGVLLRKVSFEGTTDVEKTVRPGAELEWIVNRNFSLSAYANYNLQDSNVAEENFERFPAGVFLRLCF